ncbi:hypothetical protein E0H77_12490 [Acinetobacter sp. ANC 4633]|uniref:hypothetical protein n=1 Tax=Acinetobacter sp. ANC 4633 TaxID=2529845 RepID=UPI00103B6102|nr:hypothetical protein [Acinetobacter sp. ANC 4633]TCB23934.1 hypothetical protein E0H77_12490 [Acinetobacter sp. ANC 4633]
MVPVTITDAATRTKFEICYVTAISGSILTVLRGQEGTAIQSWNINDIVFCCPAAGTIAPAVTNATANVPLSGTMYLTATNSYQQLLAPSGAALSISTLNIGAGVITADFMFTNKLVNTQTLQLVSNTQYTGTNTSQSGSTWTMTFTIPANTGLILRLMQDSTYLVAVNQKTCP